MIDIDPIGFGTDKLPTRPLPRLAEAKSVDDVLARLDTVVDWSIDVGSAIGYFASVYRRATLSVKDALDNGRFNDRERMHRLDVMFAQRYFDALNAHFHPGRYETPTSVWQWALAGTTYDEPIIFQHLLTGLNAHINLDLAIATSVVGGKDLDSLRGDFNIINGLLAGQVAGVLDQMAKISPRIATVRRLIPNEVGMIAKLLVQFRDASWSFAKKLQVDAKNREASMDEHDSWASVLATCYLHPRGRMGHITWWVAEDESRDVKRNISVLDKVKPRADTTMMLVL